MKLIKNSTIVVSSILSLVCVTPAMADLSANFGATSNFVFHGVSQTNGGPALQGGLDYTHSSGMYLGTWASNVDKANAKGVQVNVYGGLARKLGDFNYNIGSVTRQFTNAAHKDFNEFYLGGGYKMLHTTYVLGDGYTYAEIVADGTLSGIHLNVRAGSKMPDQGKDILDYGFSLGKRFFGYDVKAGVATTNVSGAKREFFVAIVKPFNL